MVKPQDNQQGTNERADQSDQRPAQPPPFEPRLTISPGQLLGIVLLALLPLLALLGFLDGKSSTAMVANEEVALQVEYVARQPYKMDGQMTVTVTNLSPESNATLNVAFEREYFDNFSEITFVPDVARVAEQSFVVPLYEMMKGETRIVQVAMKGNRLGKHSGVISTAKDGGQPVSITVSTWILP